MIRINRMSDGSVKSCEYDDYCRDTLWKSEFVYDVIDHKQCLIWIVKDRHNGEINCLRYLDSDEFLMDHLKATPTL